MLKPLLAAAGLMLLFAGPSVATGAAGSAMPAPAANGPATMMAQHITVHVPRITITTSTTLYTAPPPPPPRMFREKKADDCVKTKKIIGFWVTTSDSIDLVLDDGARLRARFGSDCPSLGFYAGFYVKPNPDGKICVGRDVLRARSGRSCAIGQFTKLVPLK